VTETLTQLAASNLLASLCLAIAAYAVHRRGRYPVLAHLLWVLVLVKIVTPPLLTFSMAPIAGLATLPSGAPAERLSITSAAIDVGVAGLLLLWGLGSLLVLATSLWRIHRFDRLLRATSVAAPAEVQVIATQLAQRLDLRSTPAIFTTKARISPMTWWAGRGVRVVIPEALAGEIGEVQLRWVLAHELAHVKRRDHLVRWLEWLACVAFWWNPVAWWARHNLRIDEEVACDAMVLDRLSPQPRAYATALFNVVEFLSRDVVRAPAVATGIDGAGSLERRLTIIISRERLRKAPGWLVVGLVGMSLVLIPLGVGGAGEQGQEADRTRAVDATAAVEGPYLGTESAGEAARADTTDVRPDATEYAFLGADIGNGVESRVADGTTRALTRAERALKVAERALSRAERAPQKPEPAIKKAKRAVRTARAALRSAERQGPAIGRAGGSDRFRARVEAIDVRLEDAGARLRRLNRQSRSG
jgi:beta-lactamase regulating signal transducer with metallopeptidase domain